MIWEIAKLTAFWFFAIAGVIRSSGVGPKWWRG